MNVWVVITHRGPDGGPGESSTSAMSSFAAALLALYPPDDVYSIRFIGGDVDSYLRSHVPFTPLAEREHMRAGREYAPCN